MGGLCVLLSAVVELLVSYQTLAAHYSLRAGLCCDMVHGHSYDLFDWLLEKGTWPLENGLTTKWW